MARPREYAENSRAHMGTRFDRRLIALFETIARRQHLTRTQALEWCVANAIKANYIPPFPEEVIKLLESQNQEQSANVVKTPKKKLILTGGKPGDRTTRVNTEPLVNEKV